MGVEGGEAKTAAAARTADGPPAEVLIVSLGSTEGLRRADEQLRASLQRAGAHVELVRARPPAPTRTLMLTDLAWARAARAAAVEALAAWTGARPPAIVYSSTTAALLWPAPGAIRFDATAAGNRPGRHGLWQRPLERRRLAQAPLLLPWSEGALREAPGEARRGNRALVLPVPVEPSGPLVPWEQRDIAAITYAANPLKKGLDRVLAAWREVYEELPAGGPRELFVAGVTEAELRAARVDVSAAESVRIAGRLPALDYRALVCRARVFVCAPRREDYGIAQLEALADGCMLATTPAPGPYAALPIARALDRRLVGEDLEGALRAALLDPQSDYGRRTCATLIPYTSGAVDEIVARGLVPALVGGGRQ
jgi:glycosyltransferase involved in cell wall biosynthesis